MYEDCPPPSPRGDMMYEIRRRKPEPTLLPTQGIFNLPHHVGMVWEELAPDDAVSYTQKEMGCSTAKCYSSDWHSYPSLQGSPTPRSNQQSYLPTPIL